MIVTLAQLCFYISLVLMAFATASNITYATALFTTALAIPILGKRVGLIRRIAVLVGFLEIIMVIQLGTEVFSAYAFFPFAAAALHALVGVTSRLFLTQYSALY